MLEIDPNFRSKNDTFHHLQKILIQREIVRTVVKKKFEEKRL